MLLILPQLLCTLLAVRGCPWTSNGACGCQQSNSYGPHGEKEPAHLPFSPALLGTPPSLFWALPQPLHLNIHSMKMFWTQLAQRDKSNSYASPKRLLKVQLQQTGLSGELEARLCSALFPSSRDWRLFSEEQENKHPTLKCTFQEVTLQILPFTELLSPKLCGTAPIKRQNPHGDTSLVH